MRMGTSRPARSLQAGGEGAHLVGIVDVALEQDIAGGVGGAEQRAFLGRDGEARQAEEGRLHRHSTTVHGVARGLQLAAQIAAESPPLARSRYSVLPSLSTTRMRLVKPIRPYLAVRPAQAALAFSVVEKAPSWTVPGFLAGLRARLGRFGTAAIDFTGGCRRSFWPGLVPGPARAAFGAQHGRRAAWSHVGARRGGQSGDCCPWSGTRSCGGAGDGAGARQRGFRGRRLDR